MQRPSICRSCPRYIVGHDRQPYCEHVSQATWLAPKWVARDASCPLDRWPDAPPQAQSGETMYAPAQAPASRPARAPQRTPRGVAWFVRGAINRARSAMTRTRLDVVQPRWEVCERCDFRVRGSCWLCGCPTAAKAKLASEGCPAGFWEQHAATADKQAFLDEMPVRSRLTALGCFHARERDAGIDTAGESPVVRGAPA